MPHMYVVGGFGCSVAHARGCLMTPIELSVRLLVRTYVWACRPAEARDGRDDDDVVPLPSHPRMVGGPVDMHAF